MSKTRLTDDDLREIGLDPKDMIQVLMEVDKIQNPKCPLCHNPVLPNDSICKFCHTLLKLESN